MTERKIILTGAIGIGILIAVALIGIAVLGGRASSPPAAREPAPLPPYPPLAPRAEVVPAAAATPAPAPEPATTAPARTVAPAAVPRAPGAEGPAPWESVETALKPSGLGVELAAPVSDALVEARDRLQPCFDEEAKRLAYARPAAATAGAHGPAVLVLRLEAGDGKLVVADTEVASQGTSSRQLVECCRRMLRSHELAAPVAPPQRYKVTMPLQ